MNKIIRKIFTMLTVSLCFNFTSVAQQIVTQVESKKVTINNFTRAANDLYMQKYVKSIGTNRFYHLSRPTPLDEQKVIRMNRDTLYSVVALDVNKPVTIELPNAGERYISLHLMDQDHFTPIVWSKPGVYTIDKEVLGSRYGMAVVRIAVDAKDEEDIKQVNKLQQQIHINGDSTKTLDVPNWDLASMQALHNALLVLGEGVTNSHKMFGTKDQVDPLLHMIGTAVGFGGLPEQYTYYEIEYPAADSGQGEFSLTVDDVPVDAFWSITVYNKDGFIDKNDLQTYVINGNNALKNEDGTVTVYFGGCNSDKVNCLPTMPGWNYAVRMYQPKAKLQSGEWKFPAIKPIN